MSEAIDTMPSTSSSNLTLGLCPRCGGPVHVRTRHLQIEGSAVRVFCSQRCASEPAVAVEPPPPPPPRSPWRHVLHLAIGEEASTVGAIDALTDGDCLYASYRDHGTAIAVGRLIPWAMRVSAKPAGSVVASAGQARASKTPAATTKRASGQSRSCAGVSLGERSSTRNMPCDVSESLRRTCAAMD